MRQYASKDVGPRRGWVWWVPYQLERNECQGAEGEGGGLGLEGEWIWWGTTSMGEGKDWASKMVDLVGFQHRLEKGTSDRALGGGL